MKKIAICGAKGSGKDTVAHIIIELAKPQYAIRKYAFSDPIRELVMSTFQLRSYDDYDVFKRGMIVLPNGREVYGRDVLRTIGMQMRSFNQEHFIEDLDYRVRRFDEQFRVRNLNRNENEKEDDLVIISDVRFKNELRYCRSNNIPLIKVKRPDAIFDGSSSDQDIDDCFCSLVVNNDGDEAALRAQLSPLVIRVLGLRPTE